MRTHAAAGRPRNPMNHAILLPGMVADHEALMPLMMVHSNSAGRPAQPHHLGSGLRAQAGRHARVPVLPAPGDMPCDMWCDMPCDVWCDMRCDVWCDMRCDGSACVGPLSNRGPGTHSKHIVLADARVSCRVGVVSNPPGAIQQPGAGGGHGQARPQAGQRRHGQPYRAGGPSAKGEEVLHGC